MRLDLTKEVLRLAREYMKKHEISMSEFARRVGISKAWLSKLQTQDANLSTDTAMDILNYLGYTIDLKKHAVIKSRLKKLASRGE